MKNIGKMFSEVLNLHFNGSTNEVMDFIFPTQSQRNAVRYGFPPKQCFRTAIS